MVIKKKKYEVIKMRRVLAMYMEPAEKRKNWWKESGVGER